MLLRNKLGGLRSLRKRRDEFEPISYILEKLPVVAFVQQVFIGLLM